MKKLGLRLIVVCVLVAGTSYARAQCSPTTCNQVNHSGCNKNCCLDDYNGGIQTCHLNPPLSQNCASQKLTSFGQCLSWSDDNPQASLGAAYVTVVASTSSPDTHSILFN